MANKSIHFITLIFIFLLSKVISGFEFNGINTKTKCHKVEKEALIKFREGLEDASNRLSSWLGDECCVWTGISCDNKTGHVTKLDLRNEDRCYFNYLSNQDWYCEDTTLGGQISDSLLDLKYLNYLDLSNNDFSEIPIPKFLGALSKLSYLNLSLAHFGGLIPSHLGNLTNLRHLDLHIDSSYIDSIWVSDLNWLSQLSSLEHLNLEGVNLENATTHWLQSINMLPLLLELHLSLCALGNLPDSLHVVNFTSLSILELKFNNFRAPSLPQWLFNLTKMVKLDLSNNEIAEDIGSLIERMSKCCSSNLEELHFGVGLMSGQLPNSLGLLTKLRFLDLYKNSISGSIPTYIGNMSNLEFLDVANNRMNGSIPQSIGKLKRLNSLAVDHNSWGGTISEKHFLGLKKLEYLFLSTSSNNFRMQLSPLWEPPFNLRTLYLVNCTLGPKFPIWLRNQTKLLRIFLVNVGIVETFPHWFPKCSPEIENIQFSHNRMTGRLSNLHEFPRQGIQVDLSFNRLKGMIPLWRNVSVLNLANNLFSGSIPANIYRKMSTLSALNLSTNCLNGHIPSSIGKMTNLVALDLSHNNLSGNIHDDWIQMASLNLLDLSMNSLSGKVPKSICSLQGLISLKLNGNQLSGDISVTRLDGSHLIFVDLGDNKLYGDVTDWIGENVTYLSRLRLRNNKLSGNILRRLCDLSFLHGLDLGNNKLSGTIPACLGNISGFHNIVEEGTLYLDLFGKKYYQREQMEIIWKGKESTFTGTSLGLVVTIDLSSNNFHGDIPENITNLVALNTLNLSHNQLTGKIPIGVESLKQLETLDLSCNHLSGSIPRGMSSMTFLNHLNLSHNNLFGQIPSGNQFSTFNDPSIYEGNSGLCGWPLPNICEVPNTDNTKEDQEEDHDEDEHEKLWLFMSIGAGYLSGFWVVTITLIMKDSWRHAFFRSLIKVKDWFIVAFHVNKARLWRRVWGYSPNGP